MLLYYRDKKKSQSCRINVYNHLFDYFTQCQKQASTVEMLLYWTEKAKQSMKDVRDQLFLSHLQLQHDSAELHVQVIGSLQFPLVMLSDIQSVSETQETVSHLQLKLSASRSVFGLSALTWARLFCGESAPRPVGGCRCLRSWSSRNASSLPLSTPSATDKIIRVN